MGQVVGVLFFALLESEFLAIISKIDKIKHKLNLILEDFEDWIMALERGSPQKLYFLNDLIMLFTFISKADPNQIIEEYYLDDQLFPEQRSTIIEHMIFPLKNKFHAFLIDLSESFGTSLFQVIKPRM